MLAQRCAFEEGSPKPDLDDDLQHFRESLVERHLWRLL